MSTPQESPGRYRKLNRFWWIVLVVFSALALFMAVSQIFLLRPFGLTLISTAYLYWLIGLYVSLVFIVFPATKSKSAREKIPWYDIVLFCACLGLSVFFASKSLEIIERGWEFLAPVNVAIAGVALWFLMIEAVRRASDPVLAIVVAIFSFFPLFAGHLPAFLEGVPFSFLDTARYHAMSSESILGIPMRVVGELMIGFMLFGVALQATGGGKFFLDLSMGLVGGARGGPAKVAVIASGFFGSMSGSAISNVITTGTITIPAMKKLGYPPEYAGAIEACASTGGVLMPPIMGAAAFLIASFLGMPYWQVAIAALVPSVLYYLGLLFQVDGYAARTGMRGLPKSEVPPLRVTLKKGWFYVLAFLMLVWLLIFLRQEGQAPFYAMAMLIVFAMIRKETRFTWRSFLEFIASCGKSLAELTALLAAVGLIIGSLSMTGVAHAFSRELLHWAGNNVALLLISGAVTSFILGMGMSVTACYIFLAIVMVPALVKQGLDPLAVHLFVLYWGMISFITPPVALAAITAAGIAGANPMKVGFRAMRLAGVIYIIPFFFVLQPALILHGAATAIALHVVTAIIGVFLLSGSIEGYFLGMGILNIPLRLIAGAGGLLLLAPFNWAEAAGGAILVLLIVYIYLGRRGKKPAKMAV